GAEPDLAPPPPTGPVLSLLAGKPGGRGNADGFGADARFEALQTIVYAGGALYVGGLGHSVRKVDVAAAQVTTVVGGGTGGQGDGGGRDARVGSLDGLALDDRGEWIYMFDGPLLRRIDLADARVTTLAALHPPLGAASAVVVRGMLYITDSLHGVI